MLSLKPAIFLLTSLGLAASQSAAASEADGWQYEVTPYLLAAGMDGTIGLQGVSTDVDASFNDIAENLDGGFMALFVAQKGPWSLGLEGVYMKIEGDGATTVTGPGGLVSANGQLDLTNKMYIAQASVGYRVLDSQTKLNLLGALRYTKLEVDMDVAVQFTPGIVFPGGATSTSGSEAWTDFVVGAQVVHPLADNVALVGYADVGAGGSDLTYQFIGGVNWAFEKDFIAKLGYRYLSWDYENDGTVWDIAASGPYLGLGIRF